MVTNDWTEKVEQLEKENVWLEKEIERLEGEARQYGNEIREGWKYKKLWEKLREKSKMKYIYSEKDIRDSIKDVNEDTINLGEDFLEVFIEKVKDNLREYTNLYRFYDRNCCGCVSSNEECDVASDRRRGEGVWRKAQAGEIFDCPVRVNGTRIFNTNHPEKGLEKIDISDRDKPPYPIIKKGGEKK